MPRGSIDSITISDVLSLLSAWLPPPTRQNVTPVMVYSYSFVTGRSNDDGGGGGGGGVGALLRVAGRGGTIVAPPRLSFAVSHDPLSKSPDYLFGIADCSCGCGYGSGSGSGGSGTGVSGVRRVQVNWCDHLINLAEDLAQRGERALVGAYDNSNKSNEPLIGTAAAVNDSTGGGRRVAAFAARLKADQPVAAALPVTVPLPQPVSIAPLPTTTLPLMPPTPISFRSSSSRPIVASNVKTKRARFTADMALDDEIEEIIEPVVKQIHDPKSTTNTNTTNLKKQNVNDDDAEPIDE